MAVQIKPIDKLTAMEHIFSFHYSKIMPRLTEICLGGFFDGKLEAVMTLGWGVRPVHTIKKLFPSLERTDYYEIGKMCVSEHMPKNTESQFLSGVIHWLKKNTNKKVLFTWADGILGKPGYVYQSANFLYGGFIWTDIYITDTGEKVHPRTSQGLTEKQGAKIGRRPDKKFLIKNNWSRYKGKQFRYCYFLCDKRETKRLLKESIELWGKNYPKNRDLEWKKLNIFTDEWQPVDSIEYNLNNSNMNNKTVQSNLIKVSDVKASREFFEF